VFIAGQLFSPTAAAGRRGPSNSPLRAAAASLRARNPALSVDRAITIRNSAESAYFHAFEDIVNRLHHAYEAGVAQDRSVIAPARYEGHTPGGQLLQAYDPSVEVIFQARRQPILARRLIVVDRIRYHAETWREIAARVRPEPPPFDVGSRIVLDRNQPGAARRDCQGYDRLADALVARGYVRLDPSVLSVGQQKFVFSRARHVVGVNGSAFTNMVFSEPGRARFDAIVPQHWATSTFACLSCALGHSFSGHLVASWGRRSRLTSGLDRETAQEILKNCML
jgi:capsular polysaccharide biosynthesis protein